MAESKPYRRLRGNGQGTAYKRGRTWTASYTYAWDQGKPCKRTKGGFPTKRAALDYIPILKASKIRPRLSRTFAEIYADFMPYYAPRIAEKTAAGMRSAYHYFDDIARVPLEEIGIDDLQDCVDMCPRGKRTRENMKYLAKQMYDYAAARHIVTGNIASYIYCGKDDTQTRPPFTPEELEKIRSAVGTVPGADYTICMIYTGFRPNEMLRLTLDSYDADADALIGGFKTNAGTDRCVPISPKIAPILRPLIARADPWIFPNPSGNLMTDAYFRERVFYPLLATLGIQPIPDDDHPARLVPYSCRHTFAQLMKNVPGADRDKSALMGHANPAMTKYYQSPDIPSLTAIIRAI